MVKSARNTFLPLFCYDGFSMTIVFILVALLVGLLIGAYLTDPFSRFTLIRHTYTAAMVNDTIEAIDDNQKLVVSQFLPLRLFAILKNGVHIVSSRYHKRPASGSKTVRGIIDDIYDLRFNPGKLLLTSGDHFSALFVRNLGVFYYPTLDRSIPANNRRWHDRQIVYLQTLAYALGVFSKQDTLTTTIVPTGRHRATCVNFYAYPSDTLYGILFSLAALSGKQDAKIFTYADNVHDLHTVPAAKLLLKTYRDSLREHYKRYYDKAFDEKAGLVNTNLRMSGAKDITKRSSALYDNVVFWKTTELAQTLGLIPRDKAFLRDLKRRILMTFWLEKEGYFLEDLSGEGRVEKYYSSDWLIVLATGFLSPENEQERHYFERSIDYIQRKKIDRPFAIKYQHETRAHRQFLAVRLAVASYGGDSIWSFWGMEYIKALMLLYRETGWKKYLDDADYHIAKYKHAMKRDKGFPEVYDRDGNLLETPLYRSIRQTGWVIGFEQVLEMRKSLSTKY